MGEGIRGGGGRKAGVSIRSDKLRISIHDPRTTSSHPTPTPAYPQALPRGWGQALGGAFPGRHRQPVGLLSRGLQRESKIPSLTQPSPTAGLVRLPAPRNRPPILSRLCKGSCCCGSFVRPPPSPVWHGARSPKTQGSRNQSRGD